MSTVGPSYSNNARLIKCYLSIPGKKGNVKRNILKFEKNRNLRLQEVLTLRCTLCLLQATIELLKAQMRGVGGDDTDLSTLAQNAAEQAEEFVRKVGETLVPCWSCIL